MGGDSLRCPRGREFLLRKKRGRTPPPPHAPQRTQMNELNKTGVEGLLYAVLAIQEAKIERPSNPGMASLPYAPRLASFPPKPHII